MQLPAVQLSAPPAVQGIPVRATFGPRTLVDYEFVWILSGSCTVTLDEREHTLTPGILQLSRPGMVDTYHWHGATTAHAFVHFRLIDQGRLPAPGSWPILSPMPSGCGLAGLTADLLELRDEASAPAAAWVTSMILDRFIAGSARRAQLTWDDPFTVQVAALLRRTWSNGTARRITVDELAAGLGLSRSQVTRLVTERCGVGPAKAIELLRLTRAAALLTRTNLTLANIAVTCGFADAFHLTKRFKAAYGMAPGSYRCGDDPNRLAPLAGQSPALVDLDRWLTRPAALPQLWTAGGLGELDRPTGPPVDASRSHSRVLPVQGVPHNK